MPQIDDTTRAQLRAQYGEFHVLASPKLPGHQFAFRRVGVAEFDAFLATLAARETGAKVQAHRQLARDTLIFPSPAAFDELCRDLPGLGHTFGNRLAELAGLEADVVVGKG